MIDTIENLSVFLRFNYQVEDHLIPFDKELHYTKSYLAIQKTRFGSALTVNEEIDTEIENTLVPPYLLQTITENAFKHGLNKKVGEKVLSITFYKVDRNVFIEVMDNGHGVSKNVDLTNETTGYGLYNIKRRLELAFGEGNIQIQLIPLKQGTKIITRFPLLLIEENESGDEYEHFTRR
ncbi:sensor histidine kinase [Virgibacillus sp. FSP13]